MTWSKKEEKQWYKLVVNAKAQNPRHVPELVSWAAHVAAAPWGLAGWPTSVRLGAELRRGRCRRGRPLLLGRDREERGEGREERGEGREKREWRDRGDDGWERSQGARGCFG
jgi:hypothetical protein